MLFHHTKGNNCCNSCCFLGQSSSSTRGHILKERLCYRRNFFPLIVEPQLRRETKNGTGKPISINFNRSEQSLQVTIILFTITKNIRMRRKHLGTVPVITRNLQNTMLCLYAQYHKLEVIWKIR